MDSVNSPAQLMPRDQVPLVLGQKQAYMLNLMLDLDQDLDQEAIK